MSLGGVENVANPTGSAQGQGAAQGQQLAEALLINLIREECPSLGKD